MTDNSWQNDGKKLIPRLETLHLRQERDRTDQKISRQRHGEALLSAYNKAETNLQTMYDESADFRSVVQLLSVTCDCRKVPSDPHVHLAKCGNSIFLAMRVIKKHRLQWKLFLPSFSQNEEVKLDLCFPEGFTYRYGYEIEPVTHIAPCLNSMMRLGEPQSAMDFFVQLASTI